MYIDEIFYHLFLTSIYYLKFILLKMKEFLKIKNIFLNVLTSTLYKKYPYWFLQIIFGRT